MAEEWTAVVAAVDFAELRHDILNDVEFVRRKAEMGEDEWSDLMKDFDHLLHHLEFTYVTFPFRILLTALCQHASGNVLRKTVRESRLDRNFEELMRAVWLCELDAGNAKSIFAGSGDVLEDL